MVFLSVCAGTHCASTTALLRNVMGTKFGRCEGAREAGFTGGVEREGEGGTGEASHEMNGLEILYS
jgi:hypothetical protein